MSTFFRGVAWWILSAAFLASFLLMLASAMALGAGVILAITAGHPLPLAISVVGLAGLGLFHLLIKGFDWAADRLYL